MPAFVITASAVSGKPFDAILCDPGVMGHPDRRRDVPVKATILKNGIQLDDEPRVRSVISAVKQNGVTTYCVEGSTKQLIQRERRIALNMLAEQLRQFAEALRPLTALSEEPELATEGLGLLFNWIAEERERLTGGASDGS